MIIGMDEVGRGAWAGPLVVGAVALDGEVGGLADSKTLKKSDREALAEQIKKRAKFVGLGWVSASEVDDLGLTAATSLACERALENAPSDVKIIIDGKINYLPNRKYAHTLIDGDSLEPAISAASIVAKVARDEYMVKLSHEYPDYNFDKHVGYGTKLHREAIQLHGLTPIHRWSYKPLKDKFFTEYEA